MIKLMDLYEELKHSDTLIMFANYTSKDGDWYEKEYCYNPSFKIKGCINKDGLGRNGEGWGRNVILCTSVEPNEDPFDGTHDGWQYSIIFKKNINEIYLDDEIHNYGVDLTYKQMGELHLIMEKRDVSLKELHDKYGAIVNQSFHPDGTYVLNIRPNEIVKVIHREE